MHTYVALNAARLLVLLAPWLAFTACSGDSPSEPAANDFSGLWTVAVGSSCSAQCRDVEVHVSERFQGIIQPGGDGVRVPVTCVDNTCPILPVRARGRIGSCEWATEREAVPGTVLTLVC